MTTVYIEKAMVGHPQAQAMLARLGSKITLIECQHYREIFNRKSQDFPSQKANPAFIIAQKPTHRVLPAPEGFGIGGQHNYYFSHLLNCPYDCRYCFLQGMYRSAHYVAFVNHEDFQQDVVSILNQYPDDPSITFFSGYDADSLALNAKTHFLETYLPFFAKHPRALLELRTKSANMSSLLKLPPIPNAVVAFSLTPDATARQVEHRAPSVAARIAAMAALQEHGWQIGLRFDPLIYTDDFEAYYERLFADVFSVINTDRIHSVSTGLLRFPDKMYQTIASMYPRDPLLAHPLEQRGRTRS